MRRHGRELLIRPIGAEDLDLIIELTARLSLASRYFRFFSPQPHLSRTQAEHFASVDSDTRVAMVAAVQEEATERIVAVGRFDVVSPDAAEFALVVRDDYQGIGLGTALFRCLAELANS